MRTTRWITTMIGPDLSTTVTYHYGKLQAHTEVSLTWSKMGRTLSPVKAVVLPYMEAAMPIYLEEEKLAGLPGEKVNAILWKTLTELYKLTMSLNQE